MPFTLLVLAAGMGSRYGGLKQVEAIGPGGEILLDYAVHDALAAGCTRLAFVVRPDMEAAFRERVAVKYGSRAPVDIVLQSPESLPPGFAPVAGREKPWGTGHAVWCAAEAVRDNFAVINADDFYGADSFRQMARFFEKGPAAPGLPGFALVGFRLGNTLSEHGAVSRGVCSVADGRLQSVVERTQISPAEVGPGRPYSGEEIVSMNCWAFTPAVFPLLERQLRTFLQAKGGDARAEFYLPAAISAMVERGEAVVDVLPTSAAWFGLTYRGDRPRAGAILAERVARGEYPPTLF